MTFYKCQIAIFICFANNCHKKRLFSLWNVSTLSGKVARYGVRSRDRKKRRRKGLPCTAHGMKRSIGMDTHLARKP